MSAPGRLALLLALLALGGDASAGRLERVDGTLSFMDMEIAGEVVVSDDTAALDLSTALAQAPVRLSWSRAEGELVTRNWTVLHGPTSVRHANDIAWTRVGSGVAEAEVARCDSGCTLLLVAGSGGTLSLHGVASGGLAWTQTRGGYCSSVCSEGATHVFYHAVPAGTLAVGHATSETPTTPIAIDVIEASGALRLYVTGAVVTLRGADGGEEVIDTRARSSRPGGLGVVEAAQTSHLELAIEDAALLATHGAALLLAESPEVRVQGSLHSPAASGRIRAEEREREVRGEPVTIGGALEIALERRVAVEVDELASRLDPARATVAGEADVVRVGDETLANGPGAAASAATGALTLAAIFGAVLLLARGALALLYSRITPAALLENENRRRVLELIQQGEALTVADITRRTGLARIVVHHHVRILETHALVRTRREGRARLLRAVGAPADVSAAFVLRDPTRKGVAEALVSSGRSTSQELARLTGLSPRLVSYHLARLEKAGLAAAEGRLPRTYLATPALVTASSERAEAEAA